MKKIVKIVSFVAFLAAFVGCSSSKSSDTLAMRITSEPDSFFPWKSAAADTEAIWRNIYEGLYKFDENGSLNPCLAKSYEVSADYKTYTFNLRDDVKFHNGEKFTSKDCVYTYENLAGLNGKEKRSNDLHGIKSVSAPDDYTFVVELNEKMGGFMNLTAAPILLHDYEDNENMPIGTGPYKFVEYKIHESVKLELNENYYDSKNAGKIKNIVLYIILDENSTLAALQSGQIQIAQMITAANAKLFEDRYTVVSHPQNMIQIFGMNQNYAPLADINVRRAITCAINKSEIIDGVFGGYATELYSAFSPILADYYNDKLTDVYKYDLELAKAYLAASNFKDGFDLTVTVPSNYQPHCDTAQVIVGQLEKLNIKCKIVPVDWATWLDKVYSKFEYQTTVIGFAGKFQAEEVLRRYNSKYKKNFLRYNNPEFDKTFAAAETEANIAKRAELFKKCQEIVTFDAPAVFTCDPGRNILTTKNVKGYTPYPVTMYDFAKLYYAE